MSESAEGNNPRKPELALHNQKIFSFVLDMEKKTLNASTPSAAILATFYQRGHLHSLSAYRLVMPAKRNLLSIRLLLAAQHGSGSGSRVHPASLRHFASSTRSASETYKFDEDLAPPFQSKSASSSSSSPLSSSSSLRKSEPTPSDSTLARTVFVRPKDGKHLVSVVHTLSPLFLLPQRRPSKL